MTSRRSLCPNPQFLSGEVGAAVEGSPCPNLQIEATEEEAAEMSCGRDGSSLPIESTEEEAAEVSRGRDGSSLPDDEDMLREILLRLPPQPSSLPRASAVCTRWRRLVTDPKFHRQFRVHHREPPLLGVFQDVGQGIVFTPLLDRPDRIHPLRFGFGTHYCALLDCRHGRVLFRDLARKELVVRDPVTGQQCPVAVPHEFWRSSAAVLCAAREPGHVHGDCHSSPFKVVLLFMYADDHRSIARVYSSETGVWGNVISTEAPYHNQIGGDPHKPATLVGNALYWLSMFNDILELDLDEHNLTVMRGPPATSNTHCGDRQIIQAEDGAIGFAILCYPHFRMWRRNVNDHGVATWAQWKTIEMHRMLGLPPQIEGRAGGKIFIRGYDEDTGVIFVAVYGSVYMVQLKSMQSRKLSETIFIHHYRPFKSFYTPGMDIAGSPSSCLMY